MAKGRTWTAGSTVLLSFTFCAGVAFGANNLRHASDRGAADDTPSVHGAFSTAALVINSAACLVCALCFITEMFDLEIPLIALLPRTRHRLLVYLPTVATLTSLPLGLVQIYFQRHNSGPSSIYPVDPDIAGRGVRTALYIPVLGVCATLGLGHLQGLDAGTKELGMVLTSNLICLTINMWIKSSDLNFLEMMIACVCIDITSIAISMAFANKAVLAHRLYSWVSFIAQIFAFGTMVVNVGMLARGGPSPPSGYALLSHNTARGWLLVNLPLRICLWLHVAWLYRKLSPIMHESERLALTESQRVKWWLVPATATTQYLQWLSLIVLDVCTLESLVSQASNVGEATWSDWGQSQSLVTAVIAMLYSLWLTTHSVMKINRGASSLPFSRVTGRTGWQKWKPLMIWQAVQWQRSNLQSTDHMRFHIDFGNETIELQDTQSPATPLTAVRRNLGQELRDAAKMGDATLASDLLEAGADVDSMDRQGYTPLMLAIEHGETMGHDKVCSLLLTQGARALLHAPYVYGQPPSPVHLAARYRRYSFLKSQVRPYEEFDLERWLKSAGKKDHISAYQQLTAVIRAVNDGDSRALKHLLDPDTLMLIAFDRRDVDLVQVLLSRFFTASILNGGDSARGTWFHRNLPNLWLKDGGFDEDDTQKYNKILEAFCEAGMKCSIEDEDGRSLLHVAAEKGISPWIEPLSQQISLHPKDKSGLTALHCAAAALKTDFTRELVSRDIHVDELDSNGLTALCHVARAYPTNPAGLSGALTNSQYFAMFKILLDAGAVADGTEHEASRPVEELWQAYHRADQDPGLTFKGRMELFKRCSRAYEVLLRAGASPAATVPDGPQPRESDRNRNHFAKPSAKGQALFNAAGAIGRETVRETVRE